MIDRNDRNILDRMAQCMYDLRPDLKPISLDEWVFEYADQLTPAERSAAAHIVKIYEERDL